MRWLQRLRPLAYITSYRAHHLSYDESQTKSWRAAFDKVMLARLSVDIHVGTMIRLLVHPWDSGEDMCPGGNPECNEPRRTHESKLLISIEYAAFTCTEIVARQAAQQRDGRRVKSDVGVVGGRRIRLCTAWPGRNKTGKAHECEPDTGVVEQSSQDFASVRPSLYRSECIVGYTELSRPECSRFTVLRPERVDQAIRRAP